MNKKKVPCVHVTIELVQDGLYGVKILNTNQKIQIASNMYFLFRYTQFSNLMAGANKQFLINSYL